MQYLLLFNGPSFVLVLIVQGLAMVIVMGMAMVIGYGNVCLSLCVQCTASARSRLALPQIGTGGEWGHHAACFTIQTYVTPNLNGGA